MTKKRILFCSEGSCLNTGFSTYNHELLPRLAKTGKYEIGEMASYVRSDDPRMHEFVRGRWKFWGVEPITQEEYNDYHNPHNQSPRSPGQHTWQFGEGKFPHVCAEFKPDIVIDNRDWWMLEYIERSPFRPYFKWIAMPTVDAEPQKEEWVNTYATADMCLSYSDFGVHVLKQYPGIKVYKKPMRTGVDLKTFRPMDKVELKKDWLGCKDDVKVFLAVMRNQSLASDAKVVTIDGIRSASQIKLGDVLLTAQGNFYPVKNIWSYKEDKLYTKLYIFGNNLEGPEATSEHKFHFENGKKPIGEVEVGERIKLSVMPLNYKPLLIDILDYIDLPKHWYYNDKVIYYDYKGGQRPEYQRFININNPDIMRLFGWYCAEGWIGKKDKSQIQFGLHSDEIHQKNEIINIIAEYFHGHVTVNYDKEYSSVTLSWSNKIFAKLFMVLFGNGSRHKYIHKDIKLCSNSIYLCGSYLEGDGSFYNIDNRNSYVLSSSYSETLSRDIRDILQANGIFTTIGSSIDKENIKYNLGIYSEWCNKLRPYILFNKLKKYYQTSRNKRWNSDVDWNDKNKYFLVPILDKSQTNKNGPFFDFEVDTDHTYNVSGYCCDNSRKLYIDALDAFGLMKQKHRGNPIVDKAVFVIHSSWPDNQYSYDYPRHIHRMSSGYYGLQYYYDKMRNDVFQTLICHDCGHISLSWAINLFGKAPGPSKGRGPKIYVTCQKCGKQAATTPDTSTGYTREQLASLYNIADCLLQVSICEGDGIPPNEAKACGVPCLVTDYSSIAEKGRFHSEYIHLKGIKPEEYTVNKGGIAIPVGRYYYEPETSCKRAHPDISVLADQMYQILVDNDMRNRMSVEARECAEENYDWDKLAKNWEYVLDNVDIKNRATTWNKPHEISEAADDIPIPDGLDDSALLDFLYLNVLKYPRVDDAGKAQWIASLQAGQTRDNIIKSFKAIANQQINHNNQVGKLLGVKKKDEDEIGGEFA